MIALTFRSGSWSITLKGSSGTPPTKDITVEIADGDATQTMLTDNSVATLTNKTIDSAGVGNNITLDADNANTTISNIDNDEIKAGAAIDATKIHDGSVDNTEFGHLNGVTSNIQTQINTNATNLSDHEAEITGAHAATAVSYNNATSGLAATEVQGAVDEVEGRLDTAESNISTNTSNIGTNATDIANIELKTDNITVTQPVNLDTIESDTALNNAHRTTVSGNPHAVTKSEVGLSNVPNTDATNASNISSGTLADARLSANVDLLDTAQTFTGEKTLEKQVWAEGTAISNNASSTLAEPNKTIVPLTGTPSVTDIVTITATTVTSERVIVLRNDTASTFVVRSTGNIALSGDDIELAQNATLILQYDLSATKWLVVGGSGAGGGSVKAEFYTHATLPATLTIGKFYVVDLSGGNATATMPTLDADNDSKNIEIWPVNVGVTGNTVTLTAGGTDEFNDPDLGNDTVYVMDVGRAKYVADYDGGADNVWHVADSYWATGMDINTGDWTVNGDLTVTGVINGGEATASQAGTVKKPRRQRFTWGSNLTANATVATINNCVIGQTYKISMYFWVAFNTGTALKNANFNISSGADHRYYTGWENKTRTDDDESGFIQAIHTVTATATTMVIDATIAQATIYASLTSGHGGYIDIEDDNTEITTDFT
jgi:hypothetical protein